jgi:hypothetical protein
MESSFAGSRPKVSRARASAAHTKVMQKLRDNGQTLAQARAVLGTAVNGRTPAGRAGPRVLTAGPSPPRLGAIRLRMTLWNAAVPGLITGDPGQHGPGMRWPTG